MIIDNTKKTPLTLGTFIGKLVLLFLFHAFLPLNFMYEAEVKEKNLPLLF